MAREARANIGDRDEGQLFLFLGDTEIPCGGSIAAGANRVLLDWNGDGALDVSVPVATLAYLLS